MKNILKKVSFDYDEKADVFYMSFGKPRPAITEEINNVGVRIDPKTNEIVGFTIISFLKIFQRRDKPITVSIPRSVKG